MKDSNSLKGTRVLIAEDCEDTLRYMTKLFERLGAIVSTSPDGLQCVDSGLAAQAKGMPFDLVVVDIRMPHMSGEQAARALRDGGFSGPIIAFTAAASLQGKRRCTEAGITNYFSKSVLKEDLVQALMEIVES